MHNFKMFVGTLCLVLSLISSAFANPNQAAVKPENGQQATTEAPPLQDVDSALGELLKLEDREYTKELEKLNDVLLDWEVAAEELANTGTDSPNHPKALSHYRLAGMRVRTKVKAIVANPDWKKAFEISHDFQRLLTQVLRIKTLDPAK